MLLRFDPLLRFLLGFINIDCGSTVPESGYESDAAFIDTGINREVPLGALNTNLSYLATVRSFPDGDRNCYTLKPLNGSDNNYLIRAEFLYGNYDGLNQAPIFDVYIGDSFWCKVPGSPSYGFCEIIHKPRIDFIIICLVNLRLGTPFINGLFLRPLNNSIYSSDLGSLKAFGRHNAGVIDNTGYPQYLSLRYSDDIYDRYWSPLPGIFGFWETFRASTDLKDLRNDAYEIPPSILKGGARPPAGNSSLIFPRGILSLPEPVLYVYWHFAETQRLGANESREFYIFASDNFQAGPITLKYMEPLTIITPAIRIGLDAQFWFSINQTNASSLPPILNAFEIFGVINNSESATNQDDVRAIMDVRAKYSLNGWNGDPCLPVAPWSGLNCSDENAVSPRITSLKLASRGISGEILPSLSFLSSLNYLNLSYNMLTGTIPDFFAEMPSLKVIDLRENRLSGSVPTALMDKVKSGSLNLSFDGNPDLCSIDVCMKKSKKHTTPAYLVASVSLVSVLLAIIVYCLCRWKRIAGNTTTQRQMQGGDDGMELKTRRFTYSDIMNMTNNLEKIIGKGGSGTVYHGLLKVGTEVAIKILNASSSLSIQCFQTEAELLMRVHHRSLVSLIGYCDEGITKALIYEYMANGNLQEFLSGEHTNSLSWKERLKISVDAAEGLEYLHGGCKPAIVHRDLKTANILLDHRLHAKLADFGMSRIFSTESASHISTDHVAGTRGYLAPEYYGSYKLNEKGDVYSFGIVILELITGRGVMTRDEKGRSIHIVEWIMPLLERGDIHNVVDLSLVGDYNNASVWKALETAIACVSSIPIQRPCMDQVLVDLKECLALELAHESAVEGSHRRTASLNLVFDSEFSAPSAR